MEKRSTILAQNVLRWITLCPSSSYSRFETHIRLKVSSDAKIEPPIQVEYSRSCGAAIYEHEKRIDIIREKFIVFSLHAWYKTRIYPDFWVFWQALLHFRQ